MIRVNLLPGSKKMSRRKAATTSPKGALYFGVMAVGWILLGGAGYYILDQVEQQTQAYRLEAAKNRKRAGEIRALIDEEALKARQKKVEDLREAIDSLNKQRRTPVFVMHELANILSTGKLPDIDEEKQRRIESVDPLARLNPAWDASSVWLTSVEAKGGSALKIAGAARDPADLDEFLKRMRSSIRFAGVTHPQFDASVKQKGRGGSSSGASRQYNFVFEAQVAFWD